MVVLGAASPFIDIPYESLENGIKEIFGRKGDKIVTVNLDAMKAGRDFAEENRKHN
jgi:indolepyruvate ferredoxin oxidoreductase beta subunit